MRPLLLCAFLVGGIAGTARAAVVPGGGSSKTDCLAYFDTAANWPPAKPKEIRCADGDPSCDADGVVNGTCAFAVSACVNGTFAPTHCTSPGVNQLFVDHSADDGDPRFDPDFQALQSRVDSQLHLPTSAADTCTATSSVTVRLGGPYPGGVCKPAKKKIRMTALGTPAFGKQAKDVDTLKLTCLPPVAGCDPQLLFAGTFDRIQRQIFTPSCAVSGCHDSQTQAKGLLLESSSAYTNLVDVVPNTAPAAALGWKRVDGAGASTANSFLYHKITGDLPDESFGLRMPRLRRKLDGFLIDIVRQWIEAGAPQSGWVPGTDQ
jgi:hypothetical protein